MASKKRMKKEGTEEIPGKRPVGLDYATNPIPSAMEVTSPSPWY
jgi:hypothetical protein